MSPSEQTICQAFGTPTLPKEFYCGVEYEIETIQAHGMVQKKFGFSVENDNSLRNNGYEYKTQPINFADGLSSFEWLHKNISYKKQEAFSERTSIHVHVNIGNWTFDKAKQAVLLYALLEPLFFKFVGPTREHSIYCVPLNYTTLADSYNLCFQDLSSQGRWHKYTAFNILPVRDFGTMEFRHLGGTGDFNVFTTWLTSLKDFYNFVTDNDLSLANFLLNGGSVATLARKAIPLLANKFSDTEINTLCSDSVFDVKLSVGGI